jgi:hypothetical protein
MPQNRYEIFSLVSIHPKRQRSLDFDTDISQNLDDVELPLRHYGSRTGALHVFPSSDSESESELETVSIGSLFEANDDRQDGDGLGPLPPPPPPHVELDPATDVNLPLPQADDASQGSARLSDLLQGMHTVFTLIVINGVYAFNRSQAQQSSLPNESSSPQTNQAGPLATEEAPQAMTGAAQTSQDSQNSNDSGVGMSSSSINQAP